MHRLVYLCLFIAAVITFASGQAVAAEDGVAPTPFERFWPMAQQGDRRAQYNIGVVYDQGLDIEQNYERARHWYEKSAAQGYAQAAYNLGVLYQEGHGVDTDEASAAYWYHRAAVSGSSDGQNNLAVLYAKGYGVGQNNYLASLWAARAAASGSKTGKKNFKHITASFDRDELLESAQLRTQPTQDAVEIETLDAGKSVVVLTTQDEWAHVVEAGQYVDGWVPAEALEHLSAMAAEQAAQLVAEEAQAAQQTADASNTDDLDDALDNAAAGDVVGLYAQKIIYGEAVNIREQPNTEAKILQRADKQTPVLVLDADGGWSRVQLKDGSTGWVASYLLMEDVNANKLINDDAVNIREEPSTNAKILVQAAKGVPVKVLETQGDWSHVQLDEDTQGWVASRLLADDEPFAQQDIF